MKSSLFGAVGPWAPRYIVDTNEFEGLKTPSGFTAIKVHNRLLGEAADLEQREEALHAMQASALDALDDAMNDDSVRRGIRTEATEIQRRQAQLPFEIALVEAAAEEAASPIGGIALSAAFQLKPAA